MSNTPFRWYKLYTHEGFWEHIGNRAVRQGKWKLVARRPTGPWQLYDMEADRTETNDLSQQHPEKEWIVARHLGPHALLEDAIGAAIVDVVTQPLHAKAPPLA